MARVRRSWRLHDLPIAIFAVGTVVTSGCATLSGDWKVVPSSDAGTASRLTAVSFDRDGRFTATGRFDQNAKTLTGQYQWNGMTLTLTPDDGEARGLPCHMRWDGILVLRYPVSDSATIVQLRRQELGAR